MKRVKCKSGLEGWQGRLQENYANYEEFRHYAKERGLHIRLGFSSIKSAWKNNPVVQGSTNPNDFRVVKL